MAGQLLQISFRGLLNVHSRYGPRDALAPLRSLFSECFNPFVTSWIALSASGWNISCPAGTFTREAISTFQDTHNGRTERRIRPYATARRGFLFTGSVRGGERLAIAFTLVDNCIILGINPEQYLVDIITRIESGWPMRALSELMPANWLAQKSAQ